MPEDSTSFQISVIIPTFNGRHKLDGLLKCLEDQSYSEFETIIVVDGSTDGTAQYLNDKVWSLKSISVIEQSNQGRSIVRNNGAKNASGELLIFFDDDMRPEEMSIQKHLAHHQVFDGSILTGGAHSKDQVEPTEIQNYKNHKASGWSANLPTYPIPLERDQVYLAAAHLSLKKETFDKLGGFDHSLTDAEDLDLGIRAMQNNIPLYVNLDILAHHEENLTAREYINRLNEYNRAHELVKIKHPEWVKKYGFTNQIKLYNLKRIFYKLFSMNFWVYLIDQTKVLYIFPKSLRYRIYDFVITSQSIYYGK